MLLEVNLDALENWAAQMQDPELEDGFVPKMEIFSGGFMFTRNWCKHCAEQGNCQIWNRVRDFGDLASWKTINSKLLCAGFEWAQVSNGFNSNEESLSKIRSSGCHVSISTHTAKIYNFREEGAPVLINENGTVDYSNNVHITQQDRDRFQKVVETVLEIALKTELRPF
jgi:hypothetical protein